MRGVKVNSTTVVERYSVRTSLLSFMVIADRRRALRGTFGFSLAASSNSTAYCSGKQKQQKYESAVYISYAAVLAISSDAHYEALWQMQ
jgi:hypothetical protein